MDVFEIVKVKLPLEDQTADFLIKMHIQEVEQTIKSYCNRSDIPCELAFTHANMVVDIITENVRRNVTDSPGTVKSIKEGDVQVTFEATRGSLREAQMEALLFDYASQLNKFRKLRW